MSMNASTVAGVYLEVGGLPDWQVAEHLEAELTPRDGYSRVLLGSERRWLEAFARNTDSAYPPSLRVGEGLMVIDSKVLFVHHHFRGPSSDD